jgi:hypothetical protein
MAAATFDTWVKAVFDHPAGAGQPQWYWGPDFDDVWDPLGIDHAVTVDYLTQLYLRPAVLQPYSLEQVAEGIWFLVGDSPAQPSHAIIDASVPLASRVSCVVAIATFFREFVDPAAPGPARADDNPFHTACYMWWDIFPTWGGPGGGEPELQDACLQTMARTLELRAELCQLSAPHGLNHWALHHRSQVERTIDAFLSSTADVTPFIRQYAAAARAGCAQ